jgi:signal peptidase I
VAQADLTAIPTQPARSLRLGGGARRLAGSLVVLHRLVMAALFLLTLTAFAGGMALHLRGDEAFVVLSGSMRPGMPVGTVVVTAPVPAAQIRRGDVITFHPPGRSDIVVTHRVIAIEQPVGDPQARFITRGDANPAPDPWAIPVVGTAQRRVFHLQLLGYVLAALQTRPGKVAVMFGPTLLLAAGILIEIWRGNRSRAPGG